MNYEERYIKYKKKYITAKNKNLKENVLIDIPEKNYNKILTYHIFQYIMMQIKII